MKINKINNEPLISVIMVCFNAAATIEATIKSVVAQSYRNTEFIVVDGESSDGTLNILERYKNKITLMISERDNGIYDAMNKSIQYINGDYVYFIGADDVFVNEKSLENFIKGAFAIEIENPCIFYGNVIYKNQNRLYDGEFSDLKFCLRNICHQGTIYPVGVFQKFSFDLKYKYLADFVMNLLIKKDGEFKFCFIPKTLAIYNDAGSSGSNIDSQFLKDRLKLIRGAFPFWIFIYAYFRFTIKKLFNG